jgi:fermentation-respiration switch protein FrsA (DUF1100 family)
MLRICLIAYIVLVGVMIWGETYLVYPGTQIEHNNWQPDWLDFEDVWFESGDGTQLHGWYLDHPQPRGYLLYCHGNGENVAGLAPVLEQFRKQYQFSIFAFDYRGYGKSAGTPHEKGVLQDSRAAHQWLKNRVRVDADQIILFGRSLGGAVAVDLAAEFGARGLIIERTFTSLPDVAKSVYPWAPVNLFMRNRFASRDKAIAYNGPLMQSHGAKDQIVPFQLGKQLFDAFPGDQKTFIAMAGVGHNGRNSREYEKRLSQFLAELR